MTADELKAIRERCEKATAGPWKWWTSNSVIRLSSGDKDGGVAWAQDGGKHGMPSIVIGEADMAFTENARTDIPALLAELDLWRPLTSEEAEKALAEADAEPASEEEIDELVRRVTDPATTVTNTEWAQMGAEIRRLRANVKLLHDATIVLRNGMGGHGHWDHTMRHGAGCQVCIDQQKARDEADRLIGQVG